MSGRAAGTGHKLWIIDSYVGLELANDRVSVYLYRMIDS